MYTLALFELYRVTFDTAYLQEAIHRAEQMVALFEDSQGGYFMTAADSEQLIAIPERKHGRGYPCVAENEDERRASFLMRTFHTGLSRSGDRSNVLSL